MKEKTPRKPVDFPLLVCVFGLVCFGIIMVYSSSYYYAELQHENAMYYAIRQLGGAVIGFACMWGISLIPFKYLKKFSPAFLGMCFFFLLLVFVPGIGETVNGATRWIDLRIISFQPAELAKIGIILFLASSISKRQDKMKSPIKGVGYYSLWLLALCGLIILQPNLSMVISIGIIWFALLFIGGMPTKQMIAICILGIVAVAFLAFGEGYRSARMTSFWDPWADPSGAGYQVIQSLYAIASGGLFGSGIGNSRQKMLFLPYRESDFIFSIIAEEIGFFGLIILIAVYLFLFWRGIKIAITCDDMFGTLVASGVVASIASQTFLNIAVAIKLIPATGLTLPFLSYGLTSLVVMMCNVGLLLNVSRNCSPRRRST